MNAISDDTANGMTREQRVLEEAEKTLHAFDDLPRLEPNPFLFTRLQAVLAMSEASREQQGVGRGMTLKPVVLGVIIILNLVTFIHILDVGNASSSREELISALRQEYHVTQQSY